VRKWELQSALKKDEMRDNQLGQKSAHLLVKVMERKSGNQLGKEWVWEKDGELVCMKENQWENLLENLMENQWDNQLE
jgi:hypothetical protein